MKLYILLLSLVLTGLSHDALAHTGIGEVNGLVPGFFHPLGGLDHLLAMMAAGILAARQGGRALWAIPCMFVGMMVVGGSFGVVGVSLPLIELGIAGSVIVLGMVLALGKTLSLPLALSLIALMAVFHGHAHGTEMPVNAMGILYGFGFALATSLLHLIGIALFMVVHKFFRSVAPVTIRAGGGLIAVAGVSLLG
ncbi:MAG: HupE/UreJ family protein [Magnetococcales bacterium]|nr:HupE/UreJ family protein [Magnetococcales bacterium]